jgi:hypothetical protein
MVASASDVPSSKLKFLAHFPLPLSFRRHEVAHFSPVAQSAVKLNAPVGG